MKRLSIAVLVLLAAVTAFAHEHGSCDMKEHGSKTVTLTGTLTCPDGNCDNAVFKVADSGQSYNVCPHSKASVKELTGATVEVTGTITHCGEREGEVLVINSGKKI